MEEETIHQHKLRDSYKITEEDIIKISEIYREHLKFENLSDAIRYVIPLVKGNHIKYIIKNGIIVYTLEFHVLGPQALEHFLRTDVFVPEYDKTLGSSLYIANVYSSIDNTTLVTRKIIRELKRKYENIKTVTANIRKYGDRYMEIKLWEN